MCFLTLTLHAQTENSLFTPIKLPKKMNDEQTAMVAKIEKYPNVTSVQYVTVNDYTKFIEGVQLVFSIPNEVTPVKAKIKRSEISENGNFVLYAIFENIEGQITLLKEEEKIFGTMSYENNTYRIVGLGKNLSALMTMNPNRPKGQCGHENDKEDIQTTPSVPESSPEVINPCTQAPFTSILCLFTPAANAVEPSINQIASICAVNFNNALSNSSVGSVNARVVIAGVESLPGFTERSANIIDDTRRLTTGAGVAEIRRRFFADIVVLFTEGNYTNGLGQIFGNVEQIRAEEATAFAIVEVEEAADDKMWTFTHEVGHLFGGRHQDDFDGAANAHGMAFDVRYGLFNLGRKRYHTIMHRLTENRDRILHFSNPNITYQGVATGNSSCCDVASVINDRAFAVSGFRTPPSTLTANILGIGHVFQSGTYYWEPSISCGTDPYTTQWDVLFPNGQVYSSQTVANDGLLRLDFYPYASITQFGFITIRMTVRSSDNQTATSFMNVYIDPLQVYGANPESNNQTAQIALTMVEGTDLTSISPIFPNPVTSKAYFDFVLNKEADVKVSLFDSQGKEVKSYLLGKKVKGHNQQEIDVANLNSGLYLCRIATNSSFITQKFTINH